MKNKKLLFISALILSACNNVTSSSNSVTSSNSIDITSSTISSIISSSISSNFDITSSPISSSFASSSNDESTSNTSSITSSNSSNDISISYTSSNKQDKGFEKFSIAYYGFNEEDYSMPIIEADTYEMGSTPMDYVYLTIVLDETDVVEDMSNVVYWEIISGDALEFSFAYDLDAYYIGCNKVGTVVIQATSCYGDIDTITIIVR